MTVGGLIRNAGGLDDVYPAPTLVIAIPVIVPSAPIIGDPKAVVDVEPTPTSFPPSDVVAKLTVAVL